MAHYEELGIITMKIVEKIASGNQSLLRHIAYDSYKPMDSVSPSGEQQPDVNGFDLIYNPQNSNADSRINPIIKLPDATSEVKTFINVNCLEIKTSSSSNKFFDMYFNIDIIFHLKNQLVDGNMRHYIIANEIDKMFNGQFIDGLSIGEIVPPKGMKTTRASDEFLCATLQYKFVNVGGFDCL